MSTALAIAGVTAVLRDLLNDGFINHDISSTLGTAISVSVLAPDRVVPPNAGEASQINLFLYLVTPNSGWRNARLPSRDSTGRERLSNAPLALDLHYLLSVYSGGDLHAEILLGYAMQLLHEHPVLSRQAIRKALTPSPVTGGALTPALRRLAESGLADQLEQIKLTPEYLSTEEMSKLWTAMQSHFRPTSAYTASVVLIEAQQPARSPLPVLSRGPVDPASGRERGIEVLVGLLPSLPTLLRAVPPARQPTAGLGDTVVLQGHHLNGSAHEVRLVNERFRIDEDLPALPPTGDAQGQVAFTVASPPSSAGLPVGVYGVSVRVQRPGEGTARESNRIALTLGPRLLNLPLTVARDVGGTARFSLEFTPLLREGQHAVLVLGQDEYMPTGPGSPPDALAFEIAHAPLGEHLARLRIDGIESPVVDLSAEPPAVPAFLDQRVVIT
jgi:hypothetical protein